MRVINSSNEDRKQRKLEIRIERQNEMKLTKKKTNAKAEGSSQ
jgi:hypothetical protein